MMSRCLGGMRLRGKRGNVFEGIWRSKKKEKVASPRLGGKGKLGSGPVYDGGGGGDSGRGGGGSTCIAHVKIVTPTMKIRRGKTDEGKT